MANSTVKKVTKKDNYKELMTYVPTDRQDHIDFINHEIELLEKKLSNGNSKANKQVADNTEMVYNALVEYGKPATVSDLIANANLSALAVDGNIVSTQKVSAYLKKLVDGGWVVKTIDKKKTYFSVVNTEE